MDRKGRDYDQDTQQNVSRSPRMCFIDWEVVNIFRRLIEIFNCRDESEIYQT